MKLVPAILPTGAFEKRKGVHAQEARASARSPPRRRPPSEEAVVSDFLPQPARRVSLAEAMRYVEFIRKHHSFDGPSLPWSPAATL